MRPTALRSVGVGYPRTNLAHQSHTLARALMCAAILTLASSAFNAPDVLAHGFAGQRFFPATLVTDDPFVADELSLPTVTLIPNPAADGSPATLENDISIDVSKRITPNFGIEIAETWQNIKTTGAGNSSISGFANLDVGAKYLLLVNAPHELLLSVGVNAEIGASGSSSLGVDRFSTISPGIFFGKGLGDLPKSLSFLRPLAVTGVLSLDFPTQAKTTSDSGDVAQNPHVLGTGLAIEYSIPYLQASVLDIGLRTPFNRLIPLVELNFQTPLDRGQQGLTTGIICPGIIWSSSYFQIGLEALIPVNPRTGHNVGAIAQLHFYLDDMFPHTFGKPLFGGR
ncbi:MAG TPA: hypothetical protein VK714_11190 [Myxococcota bacterium]|nr:hypothetical protein [Myxococcota bacterium]